MRNRVWGLLFYGTVAVVSVLAVLPDYDGLPEVFSGSDIANHGIAFFLLAFLCDRTYGSSPKLAKVAGLAGYGLAIEVVQFFLPYRTFSVADFLVDTFSVMLYYIMFAERMKGPLQKGLS